MADMTITSTLMRHIGGPSMLVTGRKSGLPAGDRAGMLLNHISPSLAARLARNTVGRPRGPVNVRTSTPSQARLIGQKQKQLKIQPAASSKVTHPGIVASRRQPIDAISPTTHPRQFKSGTGLDGCLPAEAQTPPLERHWPWNEPAPLPTPACKCATACFHAVPPTLGELLDVFA